MTGGKGRERGRDGAREIGREGGMEGESTLSFALCVYIVINKGRQSRAARSCTHPPAGRPLRCHSPSSTRCSGLARRCAVTERQTRSFDGEETAGFINYNYRTRFIFLI